MLVKSLKLNNYRNYNTYSLDFDPSLNIIIGPNGIGKTNILESLIVVSNTKSFRTNDDINLIKDNEEYARIELKTDSNLFKVVINKENKSLYIDSQLYKKTSDFIGKLNCILFKPSDLELFKQSPKERRRILDIELGKISKTYLNSILKYNSLLKNKNKLLKEEKIDKLLLNTINAMMIPEMEIIIKEREKFFEYLNNNLSIIYKNISNTDLKVNIKYIKCSEINKLQEELDKSIEKDCLYKYATFGTHHDDFAFYINNEEINEKASQGQRRMALISFKIGIAYYIKERLGYMPIILLDDVLSELDIDNQKRLLNIFPSNTQTIITNTDISKIKIERKYKLIDLGGGK